MSDFDSVSVALRVRPLVESERRRGCQLAVERAPSGIPQVVVNRTEAFTFNWVFDENDTQRAVYDACVANMLSKLLAGFNATILAYGQTGSGKTYTMGTAFNGAMDDNVGLIPRAIYDIFERTKSLEDSVDFIIKCSFMELYQEQLFDLLSPNGREESIVDLREDKNGIVIPGLTELRVISAQEVTDHLVRGSGGRAVASTAMNQQSSRSHAIFTIKLIATTKDNKKSVTTSKFHLVDLAGSERCTKTMATGDRFKEGVNINKGLLALGNVISALGTAQGTGFVRYRDSKLTRLLQDSLGGNSITLMIACVSPADYNVPETLSTLRYANRARQIKNKPIVNQDPHAAEINHLKDIIQKLRIELLSHGGGMTASLTAAVGEADLPAVPPSQLSNAEEQRLKRQIKDLQANVRSLQQQLQQTLHDLAENEMRAHISETAQEKLKQRNKELREKVCQLTSELKPDATNEQLQQHIEHMQELTHMIDNIDEEHNRTETEMQEHKKIFFLNGSTTNSPTNDDESQTTETHNDEVQEMLQPHSEEYTKKQINFNEELRLINRQLDLKQELHQRVCVNFTKMYAMDEDIEEKVKECEQKISDLENEKHELVDKLRHVKSNASAKLAEERRKRLQTLEQEITDMKRKILQQAKLLKLREKETQKIQNLSFEIQQMKECKVKLIRTMRQESEAFRQWKMVREKELMQLKNKDRKRENEMARKEALHSKQRNVLKRKCEEALAINKRLKDALERQRVVQAQRQKSAKEPNGAKIEQTTAWVERELELILSLIDAEHSLEQLMEDRGAVSARISDIKVQLAEHGDDAQAEKELESLQEELEMRNAQIVDLQQKVCAADIDARMRSLSEGLQNLAELRAVVHHLLKAMTQMRREQAQRTLEQKLQLDEQRAQLTDAEERYESVSKRMRMAELEYKEHLAERERTYEEKVAVLLRTVQVDTTKPEHQELQKIIDDMLANMETLQDELSHYKQLMAKKNKPKKDNSSGTKPIVVDEVEDEYDQSDLSEDSNSDEDPDWSWPIGRRRNNKKNSRASQSTPSFANTSDVSNASTTGCITTPPIAGLTSAAGTINAIAKSSDPSKHKRKSKSCQCRNNSCTKRCGCYSRNKTCTVNCRCKMQCGNTPNGGGSNDKDGDAENDENMSAKEEDEFYSDTNDENLINENVTLIQNKTYVNTNKQESVKSAETAATVINTNSDTNLLKPIHNNKQSPKVARPSVLNFETPSSKRKFFNM